MDHLGDVDFLAPAPPANGYLRVSAVQLDFLPAIDDCLDDPLNAPGQPHSLLPQGGLWALSALDRFDALRRRVRAAYVRQLWRRLERILASCRAASVHAVVFPEYSIPLELLPDVAAHSGPMLVFAGTHRVSAQGRASGVYEQLGGAPPRLNEAVCPVLHEGRLVRCVSKLSASKWEKDLVEGDEWAPIELPEPLGKVAVLICLDFIHTQDAKWTALVQPHLLGCRWIAVPSLTTRRSAQVEFPAQGAQQSKRYKQPVVYANSGQGGSACVYVDEDWGDCAPPALPPDSEGIVIVDIDTTARAPGASTAYETRSAVVSVSQPTLCYAGNESEYAGWYGRWVKALLLPDDEGKRLLALGDWLRESAPDVRGSLLRKNRLTRLLQERGRWRSSEELKRLTWEVLFEPQVLPLPVLRAALAAGASEQIASWETTLPDSMARLGAREVIERLTNRADGLDQPLAEASGDDEYKQIVAEVRGATGTTPSTRREIVSLLVEELDEDLKAWHALARRGDYAGALEELRRLIARLQGALADNEDSQLQERLVRARIRAAASSLNLGDLAGARAELQAADGSRATVAQRISLAELFACLGEPDRARAVLPTAAEANAPELLLDRQAVEQSLLIFSDQPLQEEPVNAIVSLRECGRLLNKGKPSDCVKRLELLLARSDVGAVERAVAADLLRSCLAVSVEDAGPDGSEHLANEDRSRTVQQLEDLFAELGASELAGAARMQLAESEYEYRLLSWDFDWIREHPEAGEGDGRSVERAMDLAKAGDIHGALALAAPSKHPWATDLLRAGLFAASGDLGQAAALLEELRTRFPSRPRIEATYAQVSDRMGKPDVALQAAAVAATALPSAGFILPYAQRLWASGNTEEAVRVLTSLERDERPRTLLIRARLLDATGNVVGAENSYRRFLARRPEDVDVRIMFAKFLWAQRRQQESAAEAWAAFEQGESRLAVDDIWFVGEALTQAGLAHDELSERKHRLVTVLQARRVVDPEAERVRANLLFDHRNDLRFDDVLPLDFALLEQLGVAQSHRLEDIGSLLTEWSQRAASAARLYHAGQIGLLESLHLRRTTISEYIVRVGDGEAEAVDVICPAFDIATHAPGDLNDVELVVSALELNLLVELDLFKNVSAVLGSGGTFVISDVDRDLIINDATALRKNEGAVSSGALERAILGIADGTQRHTGTFFSVGERREPTDAPTFLAWLVREGLAESSNITEQDETAQRQAQEQAANLPAAAEVNELSIGTDVFYELQQQGWLESVLPALKAVMPQGLRVSPNVRVAIEQERRRDALRKRATHLADKVHRCVARGLAEGRLVIRPLPRVDDGPTPRAGTPENIRSLFVAPLVRSLAFVRLTKAGVKRRRLNAEFFSTTAPTSLETVHLLGWRNAEHYLAVARELRESSESDIHLPGLVRFVVTDPSERHRLLERLALMGFPDAFDAPEIVALAAKFEGGVAAPRIRRILARMEWMAREPQHLGNPVANIRLATSYAEAVFLTYCGDGQTTPTQSETQRREFAHGLLSRLEAIDSASGRATLSTAFGMMALKAVERPKASWAPTDESTYSLNPSGSAATMWSALWPWTSASIARRATYARAFTYAWLWIDGHSPTQRKRNAGTLWHALEPLRRGATPNELLGMAPIAAAATISACWPMDERPLNAEGFGVLGPDETEAAAFSVEELLQIGAAALEKKEGVSGDDTRVNFPVTNAKTGELLFRVAAPVEAIMLRAGNEAVVAAVARQWRHLQGPHDGEAYRLLQSLENDPSSAERRRAVALHATASLWRQVRQDPAYLLRWPDPFLKLDEEHDHFEQLCAALSEPTENVPESGDLSEVLRERCARGAWAGRDDVADLLLLSTAMPGTLAIGMVRSLLENDDLERLVVEASRRLVQHVDQPIGKLVQDVLLLRMAAARRDVFRSGNEEVNLAAELPRLLEGILTELSAEDSSATAFASEARETDTATVPLRDAVVVNDLASAEGPLLRVCLSLIERLGPARTMRTRLWLGWRLYGWLAVQLQAMTRDGRRQDMLDSLRRIVEVAPPPRESRQDVLDPFGFDRKVFFNHRLAAVVHALAVGSIIVQGELAEVPVTPFSSSAIEAVLLRHANKFTPMGPERDFLEWDAPSNLSDLSMWALLTVNSQAFSSLTSETRRRALSRLRVDLEGAPGYQKALAVSVMLGCTLSVAQMPLAEQLELEAKARSFVPSETTRGWLLAVLTALSAAGRTDLLPEVESMLMAEAAVEARSGSVANIVGHLLVNVQPADIEGRIRELLASAESHGAPSGPFLLGLGRVVIQGDQEQRGSARNALLRLAADGRHGSNEVVQELLRVLGLEGTVGENA